MSGWGLLVLVLVVVAALAFGIWRARTDGRLIAREQDPFITPGADNSPFSTSHGTDLGARATLVQFSTAFCQPCRATRKILADVSAIVDGVAVIHIDAEDNLDLVRQLDVRRTPTVFVLDNQGAIVNRAVGQPRKADVIAAIGELA